MGGVEVVVRVVLLCWCCAGTWLWRVWMWSVYGVWRVGRSFAPLCLKVCWQHCSSSCVVRVTHCNTASHSVWWRPQCQLLPQRSPPRGGV